MIKPQANLRKKGIHFPLKWTTCPPEQKVWSKIGLFSKWWCQRHFQHFTFKKSWRTFGVLNLLSSFLVAFPRRIFHFQPPHYPQMIIYPFAPHPQTRTKSRNCRRVHQFTIKKLRTEIFPLHVLHFLPRPNFLLRLQKSNFAAAPLEGKGPEQIRHRHRARE